MESMLQGTQRLAPAEQNPCRLPGRSPHAQASSRRPPRSSPGAAYGAPCIRVSASSGATIEDSLVKPKELEDVPDPIIKIDNHTDPYHTIVSITYGDRLGELLDTVRALKALSLNVRRAKVKHADGNVKNKFYVTDSHTADKIVKSARLEEIRLSILQNLQFYHPEAGERLAWGRRAKKASSRSSLEPLGVKPQKPVRTSVKVQSNEDEGYTQLDISTTDRPGLLTDIVHTLKDVSVNVISAEVDTEGPVAKDQFLITYHGEALEKGMQTLVTNMLQYYLGEVEKEESY